VDECEKDPEKAWLINATGPANVAQVANEIGAKAVFISSDYVFSGDKAIGDAYSESDPVSPVNAYGHSKAAGELATITANPENLAVRISSVFGSAGSSGKGGNFVETILNKARAGEPMNVVNDMYMSPTYTVDAAFKIVRLVDDSYSGVVNASNKGSATWFAFAKKILELARVETSITATVTDSSQTLKRPMNSTLDTAMVNSIIGVNPSWEDALYRYLSEKGHVK
jgi:dTDP-4-dehydrorhamnose reductase